MSNIKTFDPIEPTSKFAICGMPIRLDTYKTCSFGCQYCFSNGRKFGGGGETFAIGNTISVKNRLEKIFNKKDIENFIFVDYLIANDYTWHCGGMSDPFQPAEQQYQATKNIIDITNEYNRHILFSTKSNTTYQTNIKPDLHSFQLSVTNINNNKQLEPNIPTIEQRLKFFYQLKQKGFKVGIRIQPFIPGISDLKILETFKDADHFTLEGIKIVANNMEQREIILNLTKLKIENFKNQGLLNLRPEIRVQEYKPIIQWLQENHKSYSIADNDLHYLGNNSCCCGDELTFYKNTPFNTTAMSHKNNTIQTSWTLEQVLTQVEKQHLENVNCKQVFFSGSQGDCITIKDFYQTKFDIKQSTFSPKFFYLEKEALNLISQTPIIKPLLSSNQITKLLDQISNNNIINIKNQDNIQTNNNIQNSSILLQNLTSTNNYYGWICPQCNQIYSPAITNCFYCNKQIQNKFINFIPYWTSNEN